MAAIAVLPACDGPAAPSREPNLILTPDSARIQRGDTTDFDAALTGAGPTITADSAFEWHTTAPSSVISVGDTGLVIGGDSGRAQVTARRGSREDSATVIVTTRE